MKGETVMTPHLSETRAEMTDNMWRRRRRCSAIGKWYCVIAVTRWNTGQKIVDTRWEMRHWWNRRLGVWWTRKYTVWELPKHSQHPSKISWCTAWVWTNCSFCAIAAAVQPRLKMTLFQSLYSSPQCPAVRQTINFNNVRCPCNGLVREVSP